MVIIARNFSHGKLKLHFHQIHNEFQLDSLAVVRGTNFDIKRKRESFGRSPRVYPFDLDDRSLSADGPTLVDYQRSLLVLLT